jgi:transmembrane sensor
MSRMKQREISAEIDAAAAEWAARIDGAQSDEAMQAELDEWLSGDCRRLGAYARACAMLAHASRLKAFGTGFDPDTYVAEHRVEDAAADEFEPESEEMPMRRRTFLMGGGAAIAAAAVGVSWQAAAHTYSTKRGEIRLVPLRDGSSMTLNTASTARVRFTDKLRYVELVDGEAMFDIARDQGRPFIVEAADTNVRAVGTSFTVRRLARQSVEVTVRQGSVDINRSGTRTVPTQHVSANMRAISSVSTPQILISAVAPSEVTRELAWREGMLSFEDVPLRQAADQFARYSDTHIFFSDPSIGNETVTGLFAANDPVGFARSVAMSFDMKADASADAVVLRR